MAAALTLRMMLITVPTQGLSLTSPWWFHAPSLGRPWVPGPGLQPHMGGGKWGPLLKGVCRAPLTPPCCAQA